MANPEKGEFTLAFGDTTLTFAMNTAALIEAQESLGQATGTVPSLEEMVGGVMRQRLLYMRAFLWGGLRKYHAAITLDGVTELLDTMAPDQAATLIRALTGQTVPDPKDVETLKAGTEGAPPPRKARVVKGRGTGDGASTSPRVPAA